MNIIKVNNLACPLDGLPFKALEKQLVCAKGHSFDVARQGYINLLPVQQKRSKHPGDSKEMIVARTAFLSTGVYSPIARKFNELSAELMAGFKNSKLCLVDAGCGEGYYLESLLQHLEINDIEQDLAFIGLDISKPAIVAAAKRTKKVTWLVASNIQPPILPASIDIIFSMFGFPVYQTFSKLLKSEGKLILVEAGPEHLLELRNIIYSTIKKSAAVDMPLFEKAGFKMIYESSLTYKTGNISNSQIMDLLCMTPHLYRASKQGKQAVSQLSSIDLTVDVVFRVLEFRQDNQPIGHL